MTDWVQVTSCVRIGRGDKTVPVGRSTNTSRSSGRATQTFGGELFYFSRCGRGIGRIRRKLAPHRGGAEKARWPWLTRCRFRLGGVVVAKAADTADSDDTPRHVRARRGAGIGVIGVIDTLSAARSRGVRFARRFATGRCCISRAPTTYPGRLFQHRYPDRVGVASRPSGSSSGQQLVELRL
jgi:hypothetical protein